jgi:hypothetical protein
MSMDQGIDGLRNWATALRAQLQAVEKAISDLGGTPKGAKLRSIPGGAGRARKPMSAEGKARIRAALKRRWAKFHAAKKAKAASRKPKAKAVKRTKRPAAKKQAKAKAAAAK